MSANLHIKKERKLLFNRYTDWFLAMIFQITTVIKLKIIENYVIH